jgi:hypothetical protein
VTTALESHVQRAHSGRLPNAECDVWTIAPIKERRLDPRRGQIAPK